MKAINTSLQHYETVSFKEQAKAFLNAYFNDSQVNPEKIWIYTNQFIKLNDEQDGTHLDELRIHVLLEKLETPVTFRELRDSFRKEGINITNKTSLIDFLLFTYHKKVADFESIPQGENPQLSMLQSQMEEVQASLDSARIRAEEAESKKYDAEQAEIQKRNALNEVLKQEQIKEETKQKLIAQSNDETKGQVSRNKAANQLSQLLHEDPMPLNRAKLTLQAASKRSEKTKTAAESVAADANRLLAQVQEKMAETQQMLNEAKSRGGSGQGTIWFVQRELDEKKKYLPKRLQQS